MRNTFWNSAQTLGMIALLVILLVGVASLSSLRDSPNTGLPAAGESTSTEIQMTPTHQETLEATPKVSTSTPMTVASPTAPTLKGSSRVPPGEWEAMTDFGKLRFTIEDTGGRIKKVIYQFSDWTCGSITNSGEIVDASGWLITDNQILVDSTLDREGRLRMHISGAYDPARLKLSGNWEEASDSTLCSGTWEASAP